MSVQNYKMMMTSIQRVNWLNGTNGLIKLNELEAGSGHFYMD
ncbi:hypothetical protein NST38_31100 [Paenibacillus sp. FSL H8-0104]